MYKTFFFEFPLKKIFFKAYLCAHPDSPSSGTLLYESPGRPVGGQKSTEELPHFPVHLVW